MNREHVISEELWDLAQESFAFNKNWIAYNSIPYFLEKYDAYFFKDKEEAIEFSANNISEYDNYRVIYAQSLKEMLKQIPYGKDLEIKLSNSLNLSTMNETNYEYLSKQLLYTGFGEELKEQLKEKMQSQEPQFTLTFQKNFGKDETVAMLQFKQSAENDMYFFNRYSLMLKNAEHPDPIKQTFFIGKKEANITLKEGYNLLNGRAIHKELTSKEGEKYNTWLQLDFKETDKHGNYKMRPFYDSGYKYDLKAELEKHPIKEIQNETDNQRLMESLQRGNRQSVTLIVNEKEQKVFIEAAPQFKSLNFYETSGQRIRTDKLYESNSQEQSVKQDEKKQSQKQVDMNEGDGPEPSQKKSKRKRQNIS